MDRWKWTSAALAAVTTLILLSGSARGASSGTVYQKTLYGPDFRSLDFRVATQFVPNTGGSVYDQSLEGTPPDHIYLEAPVDLPVGANVTAVTFYYKDCGYAKLGGGFAAIGSYYFASYKPATAQFLYHLPNTSGAFGDCSKVSFTRSKPSVATVAGDRRYVLGAELHVVYSGSPDPDPGWQLWGARVRYTCPVACTG